MLSSERLRADIAAKVDAAAVASAIQAGMAAAGEGVSGQPLLEVLVGELVAAVAAAVAEAVVAEVQEATLTIAVGGLQTYASPGGPAVTTAPIVPVLLDGVLS
jgi:hypothetical protein